MKRIFAFLTIPSVVLCLFLSVSHNASCDLKQSKIKINGNELTVEWATTDEDRIKGLQNRSSMDSDQGMIFDYGNERELSFWMKDTSIPLSIAFIDANGVIKKIDMMTPESLKPHRSGKSVRYALEVNQGWFREHQVKEGDTVEFLPDQ